MIPLRVILHPTDFSADSAYAFDLACALARDHNGRVVVAHVGPTPTLGYSEGMIMPPDPEFLHAPLRDKLAAVRADDCTIEVEHRFLVGVAAEEIVRLAEELHCDLIVMGTHGRTGLRRVLMGSVAEQVLRKAPCPVLTVKSVGSMSAKRAEAKEPATAN
ncbi:MAG: universal stress protein [Gemmataceae bacterium]